MSENSSHRLRRNPSCDSPFSQPPLETKPMTPRPAPSLPAILSDAQRNARMYESYKPFLFWAFVPAA